MKADFLTKSGETGSVEYNVIIPQPMGHDDGFTLLGFDSWEDVNDEKLSGAFTGLISFNIDKGKMGFSE